MPASSDTSRYFAGSLDAAASGKYKVAPGRIAVPSSESHLLSLWHLSRHQEEYCRQILSSLLRPPIPLCLCWRSRPNPQTFELECCYLCRGHSTAGSGPVLPRHVPLALHPSLLPNRLSWPPLSHPRCPVVSYLDLSILSLSFRWTKSLVSLARQPGYSWSTLSRLKWGLW